MPRVLGGSCGGGCFLMGEVPLKEDSREKPPPPPLAATERDGNNFRGFKDLFLNIVLSQAQNLV